MNRKNHRALVHSAVGPPLHCVPQRASDLARAAAGTSQRRRGQAILEISLLLAAVGGMFLLAFDYARVMNTYLVVAHATREGARVAGYQNSTTTKIRTAAIAAAGDFVSLSNSDIVCENITLDSSNGTYTVGGTCPAALTLNSNYRITITKTFQPVLPFVRFNGGPSASYASSGITVSHQVIGIVMDEP